VSFVSIIRSVIDGFATGAVVAPTYAGKGSVYMVPSASESGAYHIVAKVHRLTESFWICGCRGFRFGQKGDTCSHIERVQEGLVSSRSKR